MLAAGIFDSDDPDRFATARRRMIESQLRTRGLRNARVLEAMNAVPREHFVPEDERPDAYSDWPLPIGHGQTISQPFTVAFMADALQLCGDEKVLEIGTGSGYGAAVLARLAREVHTIERIPALAELARRRLAELNYKQVFVHVGDGSLGLPDEAPFDAICVTASAESVPPVFTEQLALGGRLVIPIGDFRAGQRMWRYTRIAGALQSEDLGGFAFVPLIGKYGWRNSFTETS